LLAVVPVVVGVAIAVRGVSRVIDWAEDMPRVVVPGSGEVSLGGGNHVVYAETESRLNGTVYRTSSLELRCSMHASDGMSIALETPSARSTYEIGGFSGESMFAVTIPRAGAYRLSCEGTGGPATLAVGTGFGMQIVGILVGAMGGIFGTIAIVVVVFLVRRARRRAGAYPLGTAPPPRPPDHGVR
jgi:hypothetical protein